MTIFALVVFFVSSCEEGPTKIGEGILPSSDFVKIESTDTISVWSYTMYNSSFPTNDPSLSLIGHIYDPYFGITTGEFVSQLRLGEAWNYGPVTIDSVRLYLRLLDVKGGSESGSHYLRLSEISDQISTDSVYYSDNITDTTDFEVIVELPELKPDTINDITLSLPVSFGEYLIRDTSQLFYSNTKPDFRSYFKGLYFRMSASADPLLVALSVQTAATSGGQYNNYIVLFMHDSTDVTKYYSFILDPVHKNACYNKFAHDFSAADPEKRIEHINDDNYRDTLSYLQALNGVYTRLEFPGLEVLKNDPSLKNFAINKARLIVPTYYDGELYTALTVPSSLRLRYENKSGVKFDVPDYYIDNSHNFFDGNLYKLDSLYSFNLATFIQAYLEDRAGTFKPELEIFQTAGTKSVIFRANNNKIPVKLELTYTKF